MFVKVIYSILKFLISLFGNGMFKLIPMQIKMVTVLCFFGLFYSCAQSNQTESHLPDFVNEIISTDTLILDDFPDEFKLFVKEKTGLIDKAKDSVLFFDMDGQTSLLLEKFKDLNLPYAVRLSELNACSNLHSLRFRPTSLITDDLEGNSIPIEFDFKNFPELRYVQIEGHSLNSEQLKDLLKTAKHLKGLQVTLKGEVPSCLCELDELRYLEIVNHGAKLPDCMANMKNLKYLEVRGVHGKEMSNLIWKMSNLEALLITGADKIEITSDVAQMKRLKHLSISSFDTLIVPEEFGQLDSLEILEISWISEKINFPKTTRELKSLNAVSIVQVKINEFPDFSNSKNLFCINYIVHETGQFNLDVSKNPRLYSIKVSGEIYRKHPNFIPKGLEQVPNLYDFEFGSSLNRKDVLYRYRKLHPTNKTLKTDYGHYIAGLGIHLFYYYPELFLKNRKGPFKETIVVQAYLGNILLESDE